jgi:hypothetical protein
LQKGVISAEENHLLFLIRKYTRHFVGDAHQTCQFLSSRQCLNESIGLLCWLSSSTGIYGRVIGDQLLQVAEDAQAIDQMNAGMSSKNQIRT